MLENTIKELKAAGFDKKDFEAWLENDNVKRIYALNKEKIKIMKDLWKGTPFEKPAEVMLDFVEEVNIKSEEIVEEVKSHVFKGYESE